jgi:glutamyl endopeptidase
VFIEHSGVSGRDGWVKKIQVMPGRNGTKVPFGGISATEFWTVQGWGDKGLETYDYGAIILPSAFAQDLGFYAFGVFEDPKLLASTANVAGYPGDKPKGTLWYDNRKIGSVNPDKVFYSADTAGWQSGACVYILTRGNRPGLPSMPTVVIWPTPGRGSPCRSSRIWKLGKERESRVAIIHGQVVDPEGHPVAEAAV